MRSWALHHIHLLIVLDAITHGIMAGLIAYCWVLLIRLAKISHKVKATLVPLAFMGIIMVYISWLTVNVCYRCMHHYAEWWSR